MIGKAIGEVFLTHKLSENANTEKTSSERKGSVKKTIEPLILP